MGVCQKCAGIDKTRGAKQLCFIHSPLSPSLSPFFSSSPPSFSLFPSLSSPCIGCEYPASEKSDQTDSQGSVSQCHRGCQSMLVPSCPTMRRARPTLLLPLLLVLGLLLHLADAQSKYAVRFPVGLECGVLLVLGDRTARVEVYFFFLFFGLLFCIEHHCWYKYFMCNMCSFSKYMKYIKALHEGSQGHIVGLIMPPSAPVSVIQQL